MASSLQVKELVKKYDGFSLKNINLALPEGAVMGFIGQNGAGKTTTMKAILNLIKRDGGDVKIFGKDNIADEKAIKQDIAVVFDEICFHETLNAHNLNKIFKHIYKEWNEAVYFGYTERFELPLKKKIKTFSRGMKMKIQLAAALSHNAKLLILDEPTSGLDPVVRGEILDVFMEYMQDERKSMLISSHLTTDLERIADYITFIDKGKILLSDSKDEILENHVIIKCAKSDVGKIDKTDIVGTRLNEFGAEVMVKRPGGKYPKFTADRASLEEIMRFYTRGGEKA